MKPLLLIFCLFHCLCATAGLNDERQGLALPDDQTMARLQAGEWVLERDVSDAQGAAASILIFIRAPVERIWAIIVSCRYVEVFVPGLEYCEVLEDRGDYAVTRQVVDKGWTMPRMDFTFETRREPYRHMQFNLLEGNLKAMRGSWAFESVPGGVLVRHVLVLRPLVPAPRWLVRRNMNKDLPDLMQCIRGLTEGGGSARANAADLEKCPGKLP